MMIPTMVWENLRLSDVDEAPPGPGEAVGCDSFGGAEPGGRLPGDRAVPGAAEAASHSWDATAVGHGARGRRRTSETPSVGQTVGILRARWA